jgi:hypothetical protein
MIAAVEATPDIDVDDYNAIATAAAQDEEMASRVAETMDDVAR